MKRNNVEYRLKYEYLTGCVISEGYDIHHIDLNKNNNNIKNLVSLPKKLHADYHITLNKLNNVIYNGNKIPLKELIKLNKTFTNIQQDIQNHVDMRDELIKLKP